MLSVLKSAALPIRAGVHDGMFHADDVLCAALLYIAYGRENVTVVRSRDPQVLAGCQIVLDVGGQDLITDSRVCLDHHQAGSLIRENGVKAAACGKLADLMFADEPRVLAAMREAFLDDVEAQDNGQQGHQRHLFSFVHTLNRTWKDPAQEDDARFLQAAAIAEQILSARLAHIRSSLEAESIIDSAIRTTYDRGVVRLPQCFEWVRQVVAHNDLHPEQKILFVIYPADGAFNLQVVPVSADSFEALLPLPASWAAKRDEALAAATGIEGSVFCHAARFLAVFRTLEGALQAAELALQAKD